MKLNLEKRSSQPRRSSLSTKSPKTFRPNLEVLQDRVVPAVTASLDAGGLLTVAGDDAANVIAVRTDLAAGVHRVFSGNTLINTFQVAAVSQLQVLGNGGNDILDTTLLTPSATLTLISIEGGAGDDVFRGGSGDEQMFGQGGADTFFDGGGQDTMLGGDGNDQLVPTANDSFEDIFNAEAGDDALVIHGTAGDDVILVFRQPTADGLEAHVTINGVTDVLTFSNGETVTVFAGAGNDLVWMDEGTAITWSARLFGEGGDDLLIAAGEDDHLDGGSGADTLYGLGGNDVLIGGAGNDTLIGGDGADAILAAGGGRDRIAFDPFDFVQSDKKDELF